MSNLSRNTRNAGGIVPVVNPGLNRAVPSLSQRPPQVPLRETLDHWIANTPEDQLEIVRGLTEKIWGCYERGETSLALGGNRLSSSYPIHQPLLQLEAEIHQRSQANAASTPAEVTPTPEPANNEEIPTITLEASQFQAYVESYNALANNPPAHCLQLDAKTQATLSKVAKQLSPYSTVVTVDHLPGDYGNNEPAQLFFKEFFDSMYRATQASQTLKAGFRKPKSMPVQLLLALPSTADKVLPGSGIVMSALAAVFKSLEDSSAINEGQNWLDFLPSSAGSGLETFVRRTSIQMAILHAEASKPDNHSLQTHLTQLDNNMLDFLGQQLGLFGKVGRFFSNRLKPVRTNLENTLRPVVDLLKNSGLIPQSPVSNDVNRALAALRAGIIFQRAASLQSRLDAPSLEETPEALADRIVSLIAGEEHAHLLSDFQNPDGLDRKPAARRLTNQAAGVVPAQGVAVASSAEPDKRLKEELTPKRRAKKFKSLKPLKQSIRQALKRQPRRSKS